MIRTNTRLLTNRATTQMPRLGLRNYLRLKAKDFKDRLYVGSLLLFNPQEVQLAYALSCTAKPPITQVSVSNVFSRSNGTTSGGTIVDEPDITEIRHFDRFSSTHAEMLVTYRTASEKKSLAKLVKGTAKVLAVAAFPAALLTPWLTLAAFALAGVCLYGHNRIILKASINLELTLREIEPRLKRQAALYPVTKVHPIFAAKDPFAAKLLIKLLPLDPAVVKAEMEKVITIELLKKMYQIKHMRFVREGKKRFEIEFKLLEDGPEYREFCSKYNKDYLYKTLFRNLNIYGQETEAEMIKNAWKLLQTELINAAERKVRVDNALRRMPPPA